MIMYDEELEEDIIWKQNNFPCYDSKTCEGRDCTECEAVEEVNHHYTIEVFCPERMDPYLHTEVKHYMVDITSRMLIIVCEGISYNYNMDRVWKFAVYEEGDTDADI